MLQVRKGLCSRRSSRCSVTSNRHTLFLCLHPDSTLVLTGLLLTLVPGRDWTARPATGGHLLTIVAIILRSCPIGVMALMAIVIVPLSQVASQFVQRCDHGCAEQLCESLIWLIVVAVLISRGLKKTGLCNPHRIAVHCADGQAHQQVIGYGLARSASWYFSPVRPAARHVAAASMHPIMAKSIANAFESDPARERKARSGSIWRWSTTIPIRSPRRCS